MRPDWKYTLLCLACHGENEAAGKRYRLECSAQPLGIAGPRPSQDLERRSW